MTHARYELGATATYRRRTALWIPGAGTGDGALSLTTYPARNSLPHSACYWVEVTGDVVVVWDVAGGRRKRHYTVTAGRCSCDGMRKMGSPRCKHAAAVALLVEHGHLRRPRRR